MWYFISSIISFIMGAVFIFLYNQSIMGNTGFILAIVSLLLGLCLLALCQYNYIIKRNKNYKNEIESWESIGPNLNHTANEALKNVGFGIILYDDNNVVRWSNETAKQIFHSNLKNQSLYRLTDGLVDFCKSKEVSKEFIINGKTCEITHVKENKALYINDITRLAGYRQQIHDNTMAVGYISIDNLDEVLKHSDLSEKATITGTVLIKISNWAKSYSCFFQDLTEERFLIICTLKNLRQMIDDKFTILDEIRNSQDAINTKPTISIGIACYNYANTEVGNIALTAMEMAEKRGGDQAVINIQNEPIKFIGGSVNAMAKNSLVAVRTKAEELKSVVDNASKVLITGHNMADCDALGAMIGTLRLIERSRADVKVVYDLEKIDLTAKKAFKYLENSVTDLKGSFIDLEHAKEIIDDKTLLLVVDTQSPKLMMFEELLDYTNNVAVIDHHRIGAVDYQSTVYSYIDTSASSTVELVTLLSLFYQNSSKIRPTSVEATIMLAGLVVDTNNFTFRTGVHTFDVASTLREYGADMIMVRKILREDLYSEKLIAKALSKAELFDGNYLMYVIDDTIEDRTILAKISDRLLNVDGIDAAFTLANYGGKVAISARSLENVNVQLVMEELGGGGHLQSAACVTDTMNIDEVKNKIISIMKRDYVDVKKEEGKNMKVILIADVKGHGKKGDIIEVNNGYGNYLLNNKLGLMANKENMVKLEKEKEELAKQAAEHRALLLKQKEVIDSKAITIKLKIGKDGRAFGKISTKTICEELELQTGIQVDKRKLEIANDINSIGIYKVSVNLDKDIVATFEVNIIEE